MNVTLTENAVKEIKRIIADQHKESEQKVALRVAVRGGGCSGFQWKLELDGEGPKDKDVTIVHDGITIMVDPRSALYVDGTSIDFVDDLNRRGFVCRNSNVKTTCGCGSSFSW